MHRQEQAPKRSSAEERDEQSAVFQGPSKSTHFFLSFSLPDNPTPEDQKLAADIVILDHRAHQQLRPTTPEWQEVIDLLRNAVVFLSQHDTSEGRTILNEATKVYYHHNQTRNRIRYLAGAVAGICVSAGLGAGSLLLAPFGEYVAPKLLILLFVFAGVGSLTSVLTRISSIDLKEETSNFSVYVSGFSRPLIAIFFAVIVYLILDTKILDVKFGSPTEVKAGAIYLVTSFLCGFSERFAQDIISRVPLVAGTNQTPEQHG